MRIPYCIGVAAFAALMLCESSAAFAHARLRSASPAAGSTLSTPPSEVVINFNESLEPAFSALAVRDAAGKRIDKADFHLDQGDKTTMRVSLPALGQGVYTVEWRAVSTDTHPVSGTFTFRVGQ